MFTAVTIFVLVVLFVVWKMCVIVPMREAYVKERLGKFAGVLEPGFHFLIPFVDRIAYKNEMREQVLDIPPQSCITRDNIQVDVDGLVYLKVMDAEKASYGIADYRPATLDHVRSVIEIRNITPSIHVIETLEKQMEAERQKRARVTLATAEKEALINLSAGERQEAVNLSEGERQRRINEAEGRAKEITLLAEATARGIQRIGEATRKPGGPTAVKMRIVEHFVDELGRILERCDVSVVPADLANIKGFFEGMGRVSTAVPTDGAAPPAVRSA